MTPTLCLIVATAENGVIGQDGKMPWRLPGEMKYFRACTLGKPVIMGRKTFQSIGKALPGRDNIVVTRDPAFAAAGATTVQSLEAAVARAHVSATSTGAAEIMVIGGAEIYAKALPMVERIYLTRIALLPAGDAHFPALDAAVWQLVSEALLPPDAAGGPAATACIFERRSIPLTSPLENGSKNPI